MRLPLVAGDQLVGIRQSGIGLLLLREATRGSDVAIWKDESRFGGLATQPTATAYNNEN